jgi:putative ABC transport system permease protein
VIRRVRAVPGVVDTSLATTGSWAGLGITERVTAVCAECWLGAMIRPVSEGPARIHAVSPCFFRSLGIAVLAGRELADGEGAAVVVNTAFAARLFPNGDPLGKQVRVVGAQGEWDGVVGVVADVRARGIGVGAEPVPAAYLPVLRHPPGRVGIAVRTRGDPLPLTAAVEAAARAAGPGVALSDAMEMREHLARFRAPLRWFGGVLALLAAGSLALAGSGLYGVMSYNVARRTREIGVRMALGATPRAILRMVLERSLRLVALGSLLGLIGAGGVARLLQLLVRGVEPLDPLPYAAVGLALASVALLAGYRPARRAAAVDPQVSLRAE